uniref:Uncharacterized protein n=1 Tax=Oryza punctata TaxID=4537 RepID=A0A0E0M6Z4_ORYPU
MKWAYHAGDDFQHSLGCVKPSCPAGKDRCERKTGRCWRAARRWPGQGDEQGSVPSSPTRDRTMLLL